MGKLLERLLERFHIYRIPGYYGKYDHQWTIVIDLDQCDGCEACVIACHAENNLPIVGEKECARNRAFNWIRIERYVEGEYPDVRVKFIPVLCQQCGRARCEVGCPTYATYHNQDGLNVQVYNRCIGTFTCASYCPYDVRHFNWFSYQWDSPLDQQLNPDLTVREKGVMEKCTFCIQRIRDGKERAKDEGRGVRDGEIVPACVQTCPTGAMTFGDLNDPESRVSRLAKNPRRYRLFEDLNTEPSVIYLKRVMEGGSSKDEAPSNL